MSMHGAGECGICGAHSDYCHLETATGIAIDCRNLKLRDPKDLEHHIALAKAIRDEDRATPWVTPGEEYA